MCRLCKYALIMKGCLGLPVREKLQLCESFPASSACCRGCRRFDPEQRDPQAPSLSPSLPWKYSQMQYDWIIAERHCIIKMSPTHIPQHHTVQSLTHNTRLPSSVPSWPPLGNLRAQLHSNRYFCLWHGTRSQSYTELAPDPPDTNPGKTCQCWRMSSESPPYTTEYFTVSLMSLNILPPHLVINVSCYVQVPLAANHSLVKPPQHL